ncbi:MAG: excinuclease ABC subunit A [Proteobacteria bacterium]|nr:MAG: excinuclease ABC subunit A [Pseudomonadota bacterium]
MSAADRRCRAASPTRKLWSERMLPYPKAEGVSLWSECCFPYLLSSSNRKVLQALQALVGVFLIIHPSGVYYPGVEQQSRLKILGAKENNLKDLNLEIPHDCLTVVTGLSGSGKSSLAFSTVFAEGQRRYIETFSPYTRQFFDKVKKPNVTALHNVRPGVAIQQRTRVTNSRSTVGSMTDINDFLKVIWSNLAQPVCPVCKTALKSWSAQEVSRELLAHLQGDAQGQLLICVNIALRQVKTKKQANLLPNLIRDLLALGFSRFFCRRQREVIDLETAGKDLDATDLLLVIDRFRSGGDINKKRLLDSISQCFNFSGQALSVPVSVKTGCTAVVLSARSGAVIEEFLAEFTCPKQHFSIKRPKPALFSFNHPIGACPECKGFGKSLAVDKELCVPNPNLTLREKAVQCWSGPGTRSEYRELLEFCGVNNIPVDKAWNKLSQHDRDLIFNHKSKEYWGVYAWFKWLERKAYKMHVRVFLSRYRTQVDCAVCNGARLKPEALIFLLSGKNLPEIWQLPIGALLRWLEGVRLEMKEQGKLVKDLAETFSALESRLSYLEALGLPYLTLDRQARTLSGGETQRVNLVTALGSELISTQFVLDEPSVGLHARDTQRLIAAIRQLTDRGNSLLVVEHDLDCINAADNIIELGPAAGESGGEVVYSGPLSKWRGIDHSSDNPAKSAPPKKSTTLKISNARVRNLKGFDLEIPLGRFVCLSGVSGSGKSTLVNEVIFKAYQRFKIGLEDSSQENLVSGFKHTGEVLLIDQSPLAKSPRANIATYAGVWEHIRELLAKTPDAAARALSKSAFSFNVDGGRCPECKGAGFIREDMQFLSDVYISCEVCAGSRFQPGVLEVRLREKNVSELLSMSIEGARSFFAEQQQVRSALEILSELGLGHLTLGHPLSELSGGEAQRLKLVPYLTEGSKDRSLFVFDEPTTGLHQYDVKRLIDLFRRICAAGNSVICIEHNLSVLAACDWLIDLGPEGGEQGGELLVQGQPLELLARKGPKSSYTLEYLGYYLGKTKRPARSRKEGGVIAAQEGRKGYLQIKGAREHNLKNIDIDVPLNTSVAITGISGSGKSSIAKDIIYAEGQRRYLDCLSPYARQFIKELKKPDIDHISNIKPTICVYQHTFQPSRLSTVATMSEIYNFLRLLYSKTAVQYCPHHPKQAIAPANASDIAQAIKRLDAGNIRLLAPVVKLKKGTHKDIFERAVKSEISQLRVDGVFINTSSVDMRSGLQKSKAHSIDFVLGRFNPGNIDLDMIREAVDQALALSGGVVLAHDGKNETIFSTERTCPECKRGFFKPDPEDLSFASKRGVCKKCSGAGANNQGVACPECGGARINEIGRNLRINGRNIFEACSQNSQEFLSFVSDIKHGASAEALAAPIVLELRARAEALSKFGLNYLKLSRGCETLSGGELQRLRLATAVGSPLSGVLYIFDEPSAGLHPLDNTLVLGELKRLKNQGNTVLVIEHDVDSILSCEEILDVGPGGGKQGGEVIFSGKMSEFIASSKSPTAAALRDHLGSRRYCEEQSPRQSMLAAEQLKITASGANNIKSLRLELPLKSLVCVAGVSGSGKSTLVRGILLHTLLEGKRDSKGGYKSQFADIESACAIDRVLEVDQKPIGINSRSTPASYLKIWDDVRSLLANTIEAKSNGWKANFFSYNTGKGRCSECKGLGQIKLEMSFLPDAAVMCESCLGSRYGDQAKTVSYLGLSVDQILGLTFEEARSIFANHRRIHQSLRLACELGLGYLTLGQSSTTLSGGESQRLKLVAELSLVRQGHTLYVLDEPTTGLHKSDVAKLVRTLRDLVARGNSVIVIEHDPDILLAADHVIELGPGPGDAGGRVIFAGRPEGLFSAGTPWSGVLTKPVPRSTWPESVQSATAS